jgi:toxin FitB
VIILDTNVISEPLKSQPDERVKRWLDAQNTEELFITVTTLTELKLGVAIMPRGQKRQLLEQRIESIIATYFSRRILTVTPEIADVHAEIFAHARQVGIALSFADTQIAAISKANGFAVATRDVTAFQAAGIDVMNPWER